jgi:acyl-ACP thioesterase
MHNSTISFVISNIISSVFEKNKEAKKVEVKYEKPKKCFGHKILLSTIVKSH